MLLFIIMLVSGNQCIYYGNQDLNISGFESIVKSVDVYRDSELSDRLADKLFPKIYTLNGQVIQCN